MKTQTLADKKSTNGNRYRLLARGSKFDVVRQDVYTWKYVTNGKGVATEAQARDMFDLVTL
jgi:hypothetical protein